MLITSCVETEQERDENLKCVQAAGVLRTASLAAPPPSLIPVRSHLHLLQVKTKCFFMSAERARTAATLCSPGALRFSHHPLPRGPILPLCSSWHGGALLLVCAGTTATSTLGPSWLLPHISEKQFSKSVVTPTLTRNVR